MNESIYKYADVGLIHFMAYPQVIKGEGPVLETLQKICEDDYFTLVEITWIKDPQVRKQAKSMLEQSGMRWAFGAQPVLLTQGLNLNDPDEAGRKRAVDEIRKAVDEAYEMNCTGFAFLSGRDPGPDSRDEALQILFDSAADICEYAAEQGDMPVLLETFDQVHYGKNALLGPTADAAAFAEAVQSCCPNFGLLLDLSHLPLLGETPWTMLHAAKDVMRHVHIGNCVMRDESHPAYGDEHPRFGCECGEVDYIGVAEFLAGLFRVGYFNSDGPKPLSFEVKPQLAHGETPEIVIANAKRTLNKAWAML